MDSAFFGAPGEIRTAREYEKRSRGQRLPVLSEARIELFGSEQHGAIEISRCVGRAQMLQRACPGTARGD